MPEWVDAGLKDRSAVSEARLRGLNPYVEVVPDADAPDFRPSSESQMIQRVRLSVRLLILLTLALPGACFTSTQKQKRLDPGAWGSDHVGKPVPEFTTGDECLFCHRRSVGTTWGENRHNRTVRSCDAQTPALKALKQSSAKEFAGEVQYVMGDRRRLRFLKPAKEYGKLELLSVAWSPPRGNRPGRLLSTENPHWDTKRFGESCVGCHATAVDPKTQAFSALSLDCSTCHGVVPSEHTEKPELAYLSPKRKDSARVVTSLCAQCHLRHGRSKSTGRPYPNNFVAGDNLFRDFRVDFSESEKERQKLSVADRHILENVREVAVFGKEAVTCLSCHDIHAGSSKKHVGLPWNKSCLTCHNANGPKRSLKPLSNFSKTCGYE